MFGLIGSLKTHPGKRDELVNLLLQSSATLRSMEGCHIYLIANATDDPDTIWITEAWRSKADHQASLENEAVRAVIARARPLIAEPPSGFEIIPVGGKGLPE